MANARGLERLAQGSGPFEGVAIDVFCFGSSFRPRRAVKSIAYTHRKKVQGTAGPAHLRRLVFFTPSSGGEWHLYLATAYVFNFKQTKAERSSSNHAGEAR